MKWNPPSYPQFTDDGMKYDLYLPPLGRKDTGKIYVKQRNLSGNLFRLRNIKSSLYNNLMAPTKQANKYNNKINYWDK